MPDPLWRSPIELCSFSNLLEGTEVQNCELKKFSVFRVIFASQMGMLRGFHPCHIGTLDLLWILLWIFWLNFLEAVLRWQKLPLLQKNTHRKFGEKFGENIPFFGAFFGAFFGKFFGTFFGEQLFSSKSEKFVQNPFCKRDPLRISCGRASAETHLRFFAPICLFILPFPCVLRAFSLGLSV